MFEASHVLLLVAAVFYLIIVLLLCVIVVLQVKTGKYAEPEHRQSRSYTGYRYYEGRLEL